MHIEISLLFEYVLVCVDVTFGYDGQKVLFRDVNFGIDLESRGEMFSSLLHEVFIFQNS